MVALDHLATYVPRRVLRAIGGTGKDGFHPRVDRFSGAVLFVDISGFTDLSDRLGRKGPEGTEELSSIVNGCFQAMLGPIGKCGGDILTMAGDALVVLWETIDPANPRQPVWWSVHCALEILRALPASASGSGMSVRIGIGVGDGELFYVGGVENRWEVLPNGSPFRQMGTAERLASPGEVVVSPEVWSLMRSMAYGSPVEEGFVRVDSVKEPSGIPQSSVRDTAGLDRELVDAILPKPVRFLLRDAGEHWLADMRPVTSLFVHLRAALDAAADLNQTQEMVAIVQKIAGRFEGTISGTNVDEKGLNLMVTFGLPPASHEDDPYRATQAAMAIRNEFVAKNQEAGFGISTGRVFCGVVGGIERREYAVIGRSVNLAARLAHQSYDEVFCDDATFQSAVMRLQFSAAAPLRLKGIPQPIPVFSPTGAAVTAAKKTRMVGHQEKFAEVVQAVESLKGGSTFLGLIEGEAGIGKSTLLQQWAGFAAQGGVRLLRGAAESIHSTTPYFVWHGIVATLLGLPEGGSAEERRTRFHEAVRDREWERLAPLLNDVLDLGIADNAITEQITGKMRADNTRELIAHLVEDATAQNPVGIVLEDCHWMDSASLAVATVVAQRVQPLILLLSSRILTGEREHLLDPFLGLPGARRLLLEPLKREDCVALAAQRLHVRKVSKPVADLIAAKSQGNPFFSIEIVFALRERDLVIIENDECKPAPGVDLTTVKFPDNVQGIIMRRVDGLDPAVQLTAKVASVIGSSFSAPLLRDSFPVEAVDPKVEANLDTLQSERLVLSSHDPEYTFSHAIVEEAIYDRLLVAQRKTLHERVALALEKGLAGSIDAVAPLLAHHWLRAGDEKKAGQYFGQAGQRAVHSGAYQEGLNFLTRAMELVASPVETSEDLTVRDAFWQVLRAEAFFGLGKIEESWRAFRDVARLLGNPVQENPQPSQLMQQIGQRLLRSMTGARRCAPGEETRVRLLAGSYEMLSLLDLFSNRMASSLSEALESLHQAERLGDSPEYARGLALMAVASSLVPSRLFAERYARAATKMATRLNHESTSARVREFLGMYQMGEARWEQAQESFLSAIEGFKIVGDRRREIECTCLYSTWNHYRGDYVKRVEYGQRVYDLAMATGDLQAQAWGLLDQIESLLNLGDFERVGSLGNDLKRHLGQNIYGADEIMAYGLLAALEMKIGRLDEAMPFAEKALTVMTNMSPTIVYNLEAYAAVTEVYLKAWRLSGEDDASRAKYAAKAREACEDTRKFAKIFRIAGARALLLTAVERELSGDLSQAFSLSCDGLRTATQLRMPYEEALAHRQIARLLPAGDRNKDGELVKARNLFAQMAAKYDLGAMDAV